MAAKKQPQPLSGKMLISARNVSDMLALWSLCAERRCRKAGTCRITRMTCWHECLDLVPGPAGAFVFGLFEGNEEAKKLSFDEALARIPQPWHEEWSIWHRAVARISGRPSFSASKRSRPVGRIGKT